MVLLGVMDIDEDEEGDDTNFALQEGQLYYLSTLILILTDKQNHV